MEVPARERIERRESVDPNPPGRAVDDRLEGSDRPRMPRPGTAEEPRGVHDRDGHVGERPGQVLTGDPGHAGVHDRNRTMAMKHGLDRRADPCLSAQHRIRAREVRAPEIDPKEGRRVEPAARRAVDHDSEPVVGREGRNRTDHGAGHERPGAAAVAQSSRPQRERRRATPAVPTGAGSGTGRTVPADSRVIPSATCELGGPVRGIRETDPGSREAAEPCEHRLLVRGLGLAGGRRVPAERPAGALQKGERGRQPDRKPVDARGPRPDRKPIHNRLQCWLAEDEEIGEGEEAEGRGRGLADEPEPDPEVEATEKAAEFGRVAVGLVLEVLLPDQGDHGPLVRVRCREAGRERCVGPERGPLPLVESAAQKAAGRDHHDRHGADPLSDGGAIVADRLGDTGREDRDRTGRAGRGLVECLGERLLAAEDHLALAEVVREQDREPGIGPVEKRCQEERDVVVGAAGRAVDDGDPVGHRGRDRERAGEGAAVRTWCTRGRGLRAHPG